MHRTSVATSPTCGGDGMADSGGCWMGLPFTTQSVQCTLRVTRAGLVKPPEQSSRLLDEMQLPTVCQTTEVVWTSNLHDLHPSQAEWRILL